MTEEINLPIPECEECPLIETCSESAERGSESCVEAFLKYFKGLS